jgi:phosphatidylinositol glycan class B
MPVLNNDPALNRALWRSLTLLAAVTVITACFSDLYYFPDEHYQILEFMSLKLGITAPGDLPWEYAAHIRPWMQPFLYFLIAKPLLLAGVRDMFFVTFVLRLATGLFSLAALALFAKAVLPTIAGDTEKRAFVNYLPFFGFLPYLFVRTSSETISAAFFTIGLALVMQSRSASRLVWAGLCCGMAFECRYQSALLIVGLFAWAVFVARTRITLLALFSGAMLVPVLAGVLVDYWGYGIWQFTPWLYFKVNILDGVAGGTYGTQPLLAYFWLLPAQFFALITLVLMAAMIVMWVRNPRHALSWVTLPFFVLNMVVGHKEARFLFPLALVSTAFPVLAFAPRLARWKPFASRIWSWRNSIAAKTITVLSLLLMAFLAVYPFGFRPHMPMARYLYRNFPTGIVTYSFDKERFASYPMYRPAAARFEKLQTRSQLDALLNNGPVYLFAGRPSLAPGLLPPGIQAHVVYSEFPLEDLGYGEAGTRYLDNFARFSAWAGFLKLPPLDWVTLYRLDRTTRS